MIARPALAALLFALTTQVTVARAEDTLIDVKPCNVFCALGRNVFGRTDAVAPGQETAPAAIEGLPEATDGAGPPQPGQIVHQRGEVMQESAAERAARKRRRATLERELKTNPDLLVPPNVQKPPAPR